MKRVTKINQYSLFVAVYNYKRSRGKTVVVSAISLCIH